MKLKHQLNIDMNHGKCFILEDVDPETELELELGMQSIGFRREKMNYVRVEEDCFYIDMDNHLFGNLNRGSFIYNNALICTNSIKRLVLHLRLNIQGIQNKI